MEHPGRQGGGSGEQLQIKPRERERRERERQRDREGKRGMKRKGGLFEEASAKRSYRQLPAHAALCKTGALGVCRVAFT